MKTLLTVIFLAMVSMAWASDTVNPTLDVTYEFPVDEEVLIEGFTLNKDGVPVCPSNDPAARQFTCTTQVENKMTVFTLTARSKYGTEKNATSEPYEFTPPPEMFQSVTGPTNLNISIPITINVIVN